MFIRIVKNHETVMMKDRGRIRGRKGAVDGKEGGRHRREATKGMILGRAAFVLEHFINSLRPYANSPRGPVRVLPAAPIRQASCTTIHFTGRTSSSNASKNRTLFMDLPCSDESLPAESSTPPTSAPSLVGCKSSNADEAHAMFAVFPIATLEETPRSTTIVPLKQSLNMEPTAQNPTPREGAMRLSYSMQGLNAVRATRRRRLGCPHRGSVAVGSRATLVLAPTNFFTCA